MPAVRARRAARDREPTVVGTESVRVLWPFLRYLSHHPRGGLLLDPATIDASLADPDVRIPLADAGRMLKQAIQVTEDPAIGLHAAAYVEPTDFDVLEIAARNAETVRGALECTARYYRLLTEDAAFALEIDGERAAYCRRSRIGVTTPPAAVDFAFASLVAFLRRAVTLAESQCTLELAQPEPGYAAEYRRFFVGRVRFGAGRNALVLPRAFLDAPLNAPSPVLARAFALRGDQLLARLDEGDSLTARVKRLVCQHLASGQVTMRSVARNLGVSPPTLRRHLEAEQATFSEIVDEVRRHSAAQELEGKRSVSEIAFNLGFSSVSAFCRAFRRWHGVLPTEYRAARAARR